MYPICYQWVSGRYFQPEPAMYSRCFCRFPGPLAPSDVIFGEKWETTHDRIDHHSEEVRFLKNRVIDLEALTGLQQNALQSCQSTMTGLEEIVLGLTASVTALEKSVCRCRDRLLSPAPHYASGAEEEMVEETEEEDEEDEEEGLEYATDTPSGGSYMTPPSTGGRSSPSPVISCLSRQYLGLYLSPTSPTLLPASDIPDRCTIGGLLHNYSNPPADYFHIFPTIRSIPQP